MKLKIYMCMSEQAQQAQQLDWPINDAALFGEIESQDGDPVMLCCVNAAFPFTQRCSVLRLSLLCTSVSCCQGYIRWIQRSVTLIPQKSHTYVN